VSLTEGKKRHVLERGRLESLATEKKGGAPKLRAKVKKQTASARMGTRSIQRKKSRRSRILGCPLASRRDLSGIHGGEKRSRGVLLYHKKKENHRRVRRREEKESRGKPLP